MGKDVCHARTATSVLIPRTHKKKKKKPNVVANICNPGAPGDNTVTRSSQACQPAVCKHPGKHRTGRSSLNAEGKMTPKSGPLTSTQALW